MYGLWCMVHCRRSMIDCLLFMLYGLWFMVYSLGSGFSDEGLLCMVCGVWSMVEGLWFIDYCS